MARALCFLVCAGCDMIVGLDRYELPCQMPVVHDRFDIGPPCAPWGVSNAKDARFENVRGELVVTPTAGLAGTAGCTYNGVTPFGSGGVALEVPRVWSVASGYITFQAFPLDNIGANAEIVFFDGVLRVERRGESNPLAALTYNPDTMRWWRLRPDPDGAGVVAEISGRDRDYTPVAIVSGTIPKQVKVNFVAGTDAEAMPGSSSFGELRICSLDP